MRTPRLVGVFREDWLSGSETFIRNQMRTLPTWDSVAFGLGRIDSPLALPSDVVLMPRPGRARWRRRLFKVTRRSPALDHFLAVTRPDLVHAHFGMDATLLVPSLRRAGVPLVVTFHGVDATRMQRAGDPASRLYRHRLAELFAYATTVIAVSEYIADRVIDAGAPREKVTVHHIGVPVDVEPPSAASTLPGITFVGRLTEKKGVDDLLRAYALLAPAVRDRHRLTIVGDGPQRGRLVALAAELGVRPRLLGWRAPDEVASIVAASTVFAVPSKIDSQGDTEGLPISLLEGGLHERAIVATDHSGIPEFIEDRVTGLLVPENRPDLLARAIAELLDDPALRTRLGRAARARALDEFDVAQQAVSLEALYSGALTPRGGAE